MPIIEDLNNNAKGFTSRILWYFPKPVFCKMQETRLTVNEKSTVAQFTDQFGETLLLSICHWFKINHNVYIENDQVLIIPTCKY